MHPPVTIAALILTVALPAAAQQPAPSSSDSVAERPVSGTFTELQASRGDTAFQLFCATCHDLSFHTGENFRTNWYGRTIRDLFRTLKTTMPDDNPGGLTDQQYVNVIAYIMKLNGYTAGADSLPADTAALRRIRIGDPPRSP